MNIEITNKQRKFIEASADEVLFGGAAGGGKSFGQLIDALLFSSRYPGSKQLILRRTYAELEKSLIRVSLEFYPREISTYNDSKHVWTFKNGSIIDFGYCDSERDVYRYQSAEYDVIRFDELTHFTETMYTYLISRIRGANDYPKQVKSSTNPGGVGHQWVKKRFISHGTWGNEWKSETGTRIFIPAKVEDNGFLIEKDPGYIHRLDNLSEKDRKALKYGDWDIYEGQYFSEWNRDIHTCEPFTIPEHWRIYFTMDYGLDMLACYWIAVDEHRRAYVINEIHESNLIIPDAAEKIKEYGSIEVDGKKKPRYNVAAFLAPPDMWNRRQEQGKSLADMFLDKGIVLTRTSNNRVAGWLAMKEWLRPHKAEDGERIISDLTIFRNCEHLIECIPALQYDAKNPSDVSTEPHEITHGPDAIRGFCVYWTSGAAAQSKPPIYNFEIEKPQVNPVAGGDYVVV